MAKMTVIVAHTNKERTDVANSSRIALVNLYVCMVIRHSEHSNLDEAFLRAVIFYTSR